MKKINSEKGIITIITITTILFMISFLISSYVLVANKVKTQKEMVSETKKIYEPTRSMEEIYKSNFANVNEIIPLYTAEQLLAIGSGNKINVDGKIYTFSEEAAYELKNDLNFTEDDWIPIGNTKIKFEGNGNTITVTDPDYDTERIFNERNYYSGYIENGLIFWVDGYDEPNINNAWVDKISKLEGVLSENITYNDTEKGYVFSEFNIDDNITFTNTTPLGSAYTVEIVLKIDEGTGRYPVIIYFGSYPDNPRLYTTDATTFRYLSFYGYGVDLYKDRLPMQITLNNNHRVCFSRDTSIDTSIYFGIDNNYRNVTGYLSNAFSNAIGTNTSIILGNTSSLAGSIKGTIYAVRIYNRELTEKELNINYALDQIRFNIE